VSARDPRLRPWAYVRDEYHRRSGEDLCPKYVQMIARRALRRLAAHGVRPEHLLAAAPAEYWMRDDYLHPPAGDRPSLGTCCCCLRSGPSVRSVVMLDRKCPTPGRGWGCPRCGLPNDGAVYVACDACVRKRTPPRWACRGYPGVDGRVPIDSLAGEHRHDLSRHPELSEE
jgi:hypothetical protein